MARLFRPHVPLKVRCQVAERQLLNCEIPVALAATPEWPLGCRLDFLLRLLAKRMGCDVNEMRLDHDPPLAARPLMHKRKTGTIVYNPEANDPDHLFYRPHGPQHERSHLIKTNVRGDHGQHPDRVLIKKARKLERRNKPAKKSRVLAKGPKRPWPKRKFENRRKSR